MKKIVAFLLALVMLLSMAACGAAEPAIESQTPETASTDTATEGSEEVSAEPSVEAEPSFGGPSSYQVEEFFSDTLTTIHFILPESMWVVNSISSTLYLYNVESPELTHSAAPRIQFETKDSVEKIDAYREQVSELTEVASRRIGGIEMQGHSYTLWGMVWTEYYGQLPSGLWITVKISEVSIESGSEGSNILDSVTFS